MDSSNLSKLPPQTIKRLQELEQKRPEYQLLTTMKDVADMVQELVNLADDSQTDSQKRVQDLGALITDIREQLMELNKKEAPETPDYAKPVVQAIDKLLKALEKKDFAPEIKPNINVAAPDVNVTAPVDLKGVEKLLKTDLPKAFEKAISLMPEVQIPGPDNKPLLDAWEGISEQLASIDTATRMKPAFPTTMKVVNEDGTPVSTSSPSKLLIDEASATVTYIGKASVGTSTGSAAWLIQKIDQSTNPTSITYAASGASTATWNNRASETYS